ncbi:mannose-1-phosphate guanylyltransferase/mannose-6-phosphate isomerase [Alteromonas sp. ASW11-36]|uniref:mannose-1-phosphate guanylyltransferase n=1 Tax=Alteromonas arenosi TaxID=3055817 RepID=A0ABT7SWW9_9ALTE|nr:mannose-1-phosphate guanylyltransferase/mannose-6-phosphate isomerase [Alteromonas sp. ASW11-36]MDM7860677.1 mannose-1-phosphate guanylyltransferase/mannose-6-phosphate isomerase [Alteromonas sp. ASW11-36]
MQPVVLAGGSGSRLWPKSRVALPKQFLSLTSNNSMLQDTLTRLDGTKAASPIVICNDAHRFLVAEQLRQQDCQHGGIILEPVGRNTAPAIALAALHAMKSDPEAVLLVLAADHLIQDQNAFHAAIEKAYALALQGRLVTFGIVPDQPHTGYGYIKSGDALDTGFNVSEFVEKPDLATATEYVKSGQYFWNSGMFMFKAATYIAELAKFAPEILDVCEKAIATETPDLDFIRVDADIFSQSPDDSIDYAVMEKTELAAMVSLDAGWSDVGSWSSLWETAANKDENGNATVGDVLLTDVNNSYINAEERLVAAVGVDDLVIVETKDAVLVANKSKVQDIKTIVSQLKQQKRPEFEFHREVYRPWGKYDSIDNGERFQVKRITVKPGEKLSVQMHHHRAEHWIVVSGTANVTIDETVTMLTENQSIYIPIGAVHALENPGKIPLELIEVQSGSYLGEDDIVRFSDRYGRAPEAKK